MRSRFLIIVMAAVIALVGFANADKKGDDYQKQEVINKLASMPLTFTENYGQYGEKTRFKADAGNVQIFFCQDEIAYILQRDTDELIEGAAEELANLEDMPDHLKAPLYKKEQLIVTARFINANPDAILVGNNQLNHKSNFLYGNDRTQWATNVPNYSSLTYTDIYPGIDLKFYGNGKSMKYDFIVHPGADISQIQIRYDGIEDLAVSNSGDLEVRTNFGMLVEKTPYIYQGSQEITGRYVILEPGVFGFRLEDRYNLSEDLVIDPQLDYSTFLGGNSTEYAQDIVMDPAGYAYIV